MSSPKGKSCYQTIYEKNIDQTDVLNVCLYPYQYRSSIHAACSSGGEVAEAIKTAAEQIVNNTSVDGYGIHRWKWEDSNTKYPYWGEDFNNSNTNPANGMRNFLQNDNGTGDDLYSLRGVHQVIHMDAGEASCEDDAGDYAPDGAGAEIQSDGESAFTTGMVAWSPYCTNTDLMRTAAIQEAAHCMFHWENEDPYVREHSLGTIDNYVDCSPMLAYHWDNDSNEDPYFRCPPDKTAPPGGHRDELTSCTITEIDNEV